MIPKNKEVFKDYIKAKFIAEGQMVHGLSYIHNSLRELNNAELDNFWLFGGNKILRTGKSYISGIASQAYDLCSPNGGGGINVTNGHFSELWFALQYNGKVKGGVTGETGLVSDIDVGTRGVSLKAFQVLNNVNLGRIGTANKNKFESMLNLFAFIAGYKLNGSRTRNNINKLLDVVDSKSFQLEITNIIELGKQPNPPSELLKRLSKQLEKILKRAKPNLLTKRFCANADVMLNRKIKEVKWWGVIERGNILFLEHSKNLAMKLKCKNNRLSTYIESFEGNSLRVNVKKVVEEEKK